MNVRKISAYICSLALALSLVQSPASAEEAVPGDYDNDNKSDIVVTRAIGGFLYWFARFANGNPHTPALFGLGTDTEMAGDYDGDGDFDLGVVRGVNGFAYWYYLANNGVPIERQFGLATDSFLTGYYDADDAVDPVAVRAIGNQLVWFILSSSTGRLINDLSVNWGLPGDAPYSGDINGDGFDELIVAREVAGGISWFVTNIEGSFQPVINFGLTGDTKLPPFDMDGDGIDDFIVVRSSGGFLTAYIRHNNANGTLKSERILPFGLDGDVPYTGSFFDENSGNFAVFRGALGSHFVNLPGNSSEAVQVVFGLNGDNVLNGDGTVLPEDESTSAGLRTVCNSVVEVYSGFLWKPESDHSGQPRVGRPLVIINRGDTRESCLNVYASDGTLVSRLGNYQFGGIYGSRWYSGWGCGDLKFGRDMAAAATAASGERFVYVDRGDGVCVGPINPTSRQGNRT